MQTKKKTARVHVCTYKHICHKGLTVKIYANT